MYETDGIIFDVDGTLWDSTAVVADAWNAVMAEEHARRAAAGEGPLILRHPAGGSGAVITAEDLKKEFGLPLARIRADLFPEVTGEAAERLMARMFALEEDYLLRFPPEAYAGTLETFRRLTKAGIPLFIVSNCQKGYIEQVMQATRIGPYVTDHLCLGDTGQGKGQNIRAVAAKHGLRRAVYVGDIQKDCDAAREASALRAAEAAGAQVAFFWAKYGFGEVQDADETVADIRDLPQLVAPLKKVR